MTIGNAQRLKSSDVIDVQFDNVNLIQVTSQKMLGVEIDQHLKWKKQIDIVCLNISRKITLMKTLSRYVDQNTLKQYYNAYILPIMDFCCPVWGYCSAECTGKILKLQKRAARIVLKATLDTPSHILFSTLGWLTFPDRVKYHTGIMVYKALHKQTPSYTDEI